VRGLQRAPEGERACGATDRAYNLNAAPFEGTKREVRQVDLSHHYADLRE
jgi:hypothetical protein